MKAFVTSQGEPTTNLCIWSLERNGFNVVLLEDRTNLAHKLKQIYDSATDDFLRVDADIIVNKNMTPKFLDSLFDPDIWWWQFTTFDWFKQDINHSMAYIRNPAIEILRENIDAFQKDLRPETRMSRIKELHNPRRFTTYEHRIMGIHGFGIQDFGYVKRLKEQRGQLELYDFELAARLNEL